MAAATATISGMSKKKQPGSGEDPKPSGRSPSHTVFARIPTPLGEALEKFLASQRPPPSITGVVVTALEDFLRERGFWGEDEPKEGDQ